MEPMTRTHVVLPTKIIEEIDALVGPRRRSAWLAETVEERLRRERLLRALDAIKNTPPPEPGEAEWDEYDSPEEWVRAIRRTESPRERRIRESWLEPNLEHEE